VSRPAVVIVVPESTVSLRDQVTDWSTLAAGRQPAKKVRVNGGSRDRRPPVSTVPLRGVAEDRETCGASLLAGARGVGLKSAASPLLSTLHIFFAGCLPAQQL
jgi:hypothetical protein